MLVVLTDADHVVPRQRSQPTFDNGLEQNLIQYLQANVQSYHSRDMS